jgi:16S rRNA (cytidine1402-2'-O)-methyltransferase
VKSSKINLKNLKSKGALYLIPNTLGESNPLNVLPQSILSLVTDLDYFIVENEKVARKFIKSICPSKIQSTLNLCVLDKHNADNLNYKSYLNLCLQGISVGLMSDAGCPGIADPGAFAVLEAHRLKIKVVPMVGPSSIFLALMSSGLNGQNFAFSGYLPIDKIDKIKKIKWLELQSLTLGQSQIFMETPYRNNKFLDDLITCLNSNTYLTIACDITLDTEFIETKPISEWKKNKVDLHHRPCIFIIQKN